MIEAVLMETQCTHHGPPPEGTLPTNSDSTRTSTLQTNEARSKSPESRHRMSGYDRRARRQTQQLSHITEVSGLLCAEMETYWSNTSRLLRCAYHLVVHGETGAKLVVNACVKIEDKRTWPKESSTFKITVSASRRRKKRKGCGTKAKI